MKVYLTIAAPVLERFPEFAVYIVRVRNMRAAFSGRDTAAVLSKVVAECNVPADGVAAHEIVLAWREAYGAMGVKPSKFRSSIEALLRRAVKRANMALPIPAVNIYNACSISSLSPIGAYDVTRMPGTQLMLRKAHPATDRFDPLGAEPAAFPISSELIVYAVADEVLCWGVNCRDSKVAALTDTTDDGIFFSEAIKLGHRNRAKEAIASLKSTMASYGAHCEDIICADHSLCTVTI
jgi:DNA/RNA-binding domain of Phe-tRNA-synthetase-like protein